MSQYTALTARAAGDLDPTFGRGNGKIEMTAITFYSTPGQYIDKGPDEAFFIAGNFSSSQKGTVPAITRFLETGAVPTGFGYVGGINIPDARDFKTRKPIFMVQNPPEHSKILMCGVSSNRIKLARFDMDGRPDESFGNAGVVDLILPINPATSDQEGPQASRADDETGPCLEHNGKIYIINRVYMPVWIAFVAVLSRLNGDGSLDTSFNGTGFVLIVNQYWGNTQIMDMVITEGKITLCGVLHLSTTDARSALVVRLNEDGGFANEFGDEGWVTVDGTDFSFERLVGHSNGRVLAAGYGQKDTSRSGLLACLNEKGQLDPGFNGGSLLFENFGGRSFEFSGAAKADDRFIVTGTLDSPDGSSGFLVARYMADGKRDPGFGAGTGFTYTPIVGYRAEARNMALQDDGKILVVGNQNDDKGGLKTLIYRYLTSPQ